MPRFHVTVEAFGHILSESVEAPNEGAAREIVFDRIGLHVEVKPVRPVQELIDEALAGGS